ncbi:MAG TPA: RICIN domain-containing protein [Spirochaetota bacterium]|nr:RICIN domain-containing protein [Spirochaetota bacterium]
MNKLVLAGLCVLVVFLVSCGAGSADPVADGRFMIVSKASGMALDVPAASSEPGKQIVQWTINSKDKPSSNQVWKFIKSGQDGQWKIVSELSKLCLDVQGNSTNNNAAVVQWNDNGSVASNQIWILKKGDGGYTMQALHSGKMLTVFGVSTEKGGPLVQFEPLTVKPENQVFRLVAVKK